MKHTQGWWLPDNDVHIKEYFMSINKPEYQPVHRSTALSYCDKFRLALDIGAHVGLWARDLTNRFAKVVAFEPCPEFADLLVINAPKVTLRNCALGDYEGTVALDVADDNTGTTRIARGVEGSVPMKTLDSFGFTDVDFVKIDVEGYELDVVKGGFETFKNNDPVVIIEQKAKYADPAKGQHAAVRFLMRELNYRSLDRVVDDWILRK